MRRLIGRALLWFLEPVSPRKTVQPRAEIAVRITLTPDSLAEVRATLDALRREIQQLSRAMP